MAKTRIRSKLREIQHARLADNGEAVERIADWLRENDLYITTENVRVAVDDVLGIPRVVNMSGGGV